MNGSAYVKDDDARAVSVDGCTQRTRTRVVKVCDVNHLSAASTGGVATEALCARKGRGRIELCLHAACANKQHQKRNNP